MTRHSWRLMVIGWALLAAGVAPARSGPVDRHSFARPDEVRVTDVDLDLTVDFQVREVRGTAVLTVERPPGAPADAPLVLDTKSLWVQGVTLPGDPNPHDPGTPVSRKSGADDPILGRALEIALPAGQSRVRIAYKTTHGSSALQWVRPAGTAGGRKPFLFTQAEAIHARTWMPIQDSPGVRVTYRAAVTVTGGMTALMSADRVVPGLVGPVNEPTVIEPTHDGKPQAFHFRMDQPIPPYLIALAVGDLQFRPLGPRTGVWAEPGVVDAAAREFADTEAMVTAIEKRYGPYRWGRYELLVLPPSFPFGGMENPKLTFATPTVIAGDKSLVSLVAHELAHSWSGNLVTNATWRDFWLNEGFTTYLERQTVEDLYGPARATLERALGGDTLRGELASLPPNDQILHIELEGRDPDVGMTRIPYEKGALFLTAVERAVGGDEFDKFLRGYFDHFAFRSITTDDFRNYLLEKFPAVAKRVDLHAWLDEPGLPDDAPHWGSFASSSARADAERWARRSVATGDLKTAKWSTQQWLLFLRALPAGLAPDRLADLDRAFRLTDRENAEVATQWLLIAVRDHYPPADARLERFLTTIGRRKFVAPLYAELMKTPEGMARARAIYAKARPFYHPITSGTVDKLLGAPKGE